jgi:glycosyltransferase involved in cell wall biosynthesis
MRIAIDARSLEGDKTGVGRYLENMLRVWSKEKNIEFVLYFQKDIPDDSFLRSDNLNLRVIGSFWGIYSNFIFQHFLLPLNLRKDKTNFFFSPFYLKPFFCPVKSAIALHDISYEAHPEWFDGKSQFILRFLSKVSASASDIIFTVSEFSKSEIVRLYGTSPEKIIVTHLAPDSEFNRALDSSAVLSVKQKYGLGKFALCLGTIFTRRHIVELMEAFGKFSEKSEEYQLLIVGKNRTYPLVDIDEKIERINSSRIKIIHLDFLNEDELKAIYEASEAVIYLSDYEGFGLPVVEAQYFDKPVITSYNTSLIEVGGDSVEFVSENSVDLIFRALKNVLGQAKRREELIAKGRDNLKRFGWKGSATQVLQNILKELS